MSNNIREYHNDIMIYLDDKLSFEEKQLLLNVKKFFKILRYDCENKKIFLNKKTFKYKIIIIDQYNNNYTIQSD